MKKIINKIYFNIVKIFYRPGIEKLPFLRLIHRSIKSYFTPPIVDVLGHTMYLDKFDSLRLALNGSYEPFESNFIKQEIKNNYIVLNIGANIGYYTLLAARAVGDEGRVYAFEPEPNNFKLLKKNMAINSYKNVVLVEKAVSDKAGKIKLFINEDNSGDHRIYDSGDGRKYIEAETVVLDEYFADNSQIDFIIMDTQGADFSIFKGMKNIIRKNNNLKIATEFWPFGLKKMGFEPRDYLEAILDQGFKIFEINEGEKKIIPVSEKEILDKCSGDSYINLFLIK